MTLPKLPNPLTAAVFAAAVLACPLAAAADDAATLTSCIAAEEYGHACIGRISEPCMAEPGGETTAGMITCTGRETEAWDALLNIEYQRLIEQLGGKGTDKMRDAQRAWITMRDGDCALAYETFEGGTIAGVIAAGCMLDRTATRTLQLRKLRETNGPE